MIASPRDEVNSKAPRIISIQIPVDKIGEVIGPKGKRINEIIALTGADIDIQDDGTVFIGSTTGGEGADQAAHMIDEIANPRPVLVGETYEGTVVKTTTFGAFVNLVPGRDGLVHISKLGRGKRLQSVEEAVQGRRQAHRAGRGHRRAGQDQPEAGRARVGGARKAPTRTVGGGERRPRDDRGGRGGGERGGRGGGERSGVPSGSGGGRRRQAARPSVPRSA